MHLAGTTLIDFLISLGVIMTGTRLCLNCVATRNTRQAGRPDRTDALFMGYLDVIGTDSDVCIRL